MGVAFAGTVQNPYVAVGLLSLAGFAHQTLSVTVITRDEGADLAGALESVSWADEIVVVDAGSVDQTVAIARRWV